MLPLPWTLLPFPLPPQLTRALFRFPSLSHAHPKPFYNRVCLQLYTNSNEEDVAPESGAIIPAEHSPSGKALLVAAYEETNTLAVFEISTE